MQIWTLLVQSPNLDGPRVTVHRTEQDAYERLDNYHADDSDIDSEITEHTL